MTVLAGQSQIKDEPPSSPDDPHGQRLAVESQIREISALPEPIGKT